MKLANGTPTYHLSYSPFTGNGATTVTVLDDDGGTVFEDAVADIHHDPSRLVYCDTFATATGDEDGANGIYISLQRDARHMPKTVRQLVAAHPELRPVVVEGLLREGETLNLVANPKRGKTWLAICLAICVAAGLSFLGRFLCRRGRVLYIDNELHPESSAKRFPQVARAMGVLTDDYADSVTVYNLRGRLKDIHGMREFFDTLEPGAWSVIILDAIYRFMPDGVGENDNNAIAQIYNLLDTYAARLGCCFCLIHHMPKGNAADKSVTDAAAGAGAFARATDTQLIARDHEQDGAVVFDAAVRSFPPVHAFCARWEWPLFHPADDLDPTRLKRPAGRGGRPRKTDELKGEFDEAAKEVWTLETFTTAFLTGTGQTQDQILSAAEGRGLSARRAKQLLGAAVDGGHAHRWDLGRNVKQRFATRPPLPSDLFQKGDECQ